MFEKLSSALYTTSTTTPKSPNITHIQKQKKIHKKKVKQLHDALWKLYTRTLSLLYNMCSAAMQCCL